VTELAAPVHPVAASTVRVSVLRDRTVVQGSVELIGDWSEDGSDCIWIDISSPSKEDVEPLLEEWFRFHELAAEDALSPNTLPKYDSFPRYDFFIFRSIAMNVIEHGVESEKLACFLGKNFLFTIHRSTLEAVDATWTRLPQDVRMMQRGVDFILYQVLDYLVDQHFPLIEQIEERLDQIHELIFADPSQRLLDELLDIKRDLIGEFVADERDMATSTMEAYLSVVANRTNEIMKVLTIFSSILLPVNFVAGIYGMNFEFMPELHWRWGFLWAVGLMTLIAAIMLTWFWKEGWLWTGRKSSFRRALHVRRRLRNKRSVA
jgi:magnesium transporter